MKLEKINPQKIIVPDVRVTSDWDPDMLEMFKNSVKESGIENPIFILRDGEKLILVDGLHRLNEAKQRGFKTIDCIVKEGKLKDAMLKNLMLDKLRGKHKASQMVAVINDLYRNHKVTIEEIIKKTGFRQDYIDEMLAIGSAHHEVWEALDNEEIGVGHAFQLSRLPDATNQLKLLHQTRVYKLKIADLKEIIDEAIRLIKEQEHKDNGKEVLLPPKPRTATCHFCQGEYDPRNLSTPIMCMSCYGYLMGQIQAERIKLEEEQKKLAEEAEKQIKVVSESDKEP